MRVAKGRIHKYRDKNIEFNSATINNTRMPNFKHFQTHQTSYEFGAMTLFLSLNAFVGATTVIMDEARHNTEASFQIWEPFVWEFSSALSILILLPVIFWLTRSRHSDWTKPAKTVAIYFLVSIIFSVLHISLMVIMRHLVYWFQSMNYQFGNLRYELLYEYRKDLITFISLIFVICCYRFILERLRGAASIVANGEGAPQPSNTEHILVKKLDKEFIVKISDIEWLESSGNYVNLYVDGRIYPTRNTLSMLIADISDKGFCRIHRSYGVNLNAVDSISSMPSGSGEVTLKSGKILSLSRRYHQTLKLSLGKR